MSKLYNGKLIVIPKEDPSEIKTIILGNNKPTKAKAMQARAGRKYGGRMKLKGGSFPDHSGDGKITKKDILMAKGVIPKPKKKNKKMMAKKKSPRAKAMGMA